MPERTFILVDLAGFTALTEAHGDEEAAGFAQRLVAIARDALIKDERVIKTMGDAVLLASQSPDAGLDLCERILKQFADEKNFPVPRTGIHHGSAVERDGDFFGAAVNFTARIAAQAFGGQVLGTRAVADAARARGDGVVDLGSFELKNVTEEVELFEIHVGPRLAGGAIDPICRMRVEREDAVGRLREGGADYWFCSMQCASTFAADPQKFTKLEADVAGGEPRCGDPRSDDDGHQQSRAEKLDEGSTT